MSDQEHSSIPIPMMEPLGYSDGAEVTRRSTSRRQRRNSSVTALQCVVALSCITVACCFAPAVPSKSSSYSSSSSSKLFSVRLGARKKTALPEMVQQVKPRTVSDKDRERAIEAMMQQQANEAAVVDAGMLEMLSDSYIYPAAASPASRTKAFGSRGRPEMVPGAMSYETMLNHRKRAEDAKKGKISIQSFINNGDAHKGSNNNRHGIGDDDFSEQEIGRPYGRGGAMTPKRGRGRPPKVKADGSVPTRKKMVKGSRKLTATAGKKKAKSGDDGPVKKRKRVVKNLPTPRARNKNDKYDDEPPPMTFGTVKKGGRKQSVAADLQRYYRTELLTGKEEYSLGTKVQFMVKCENVHEGLAIRLERLPTVLEWAHACGFDDPDPEFYERDAYIELRPAGFEDMFLVKDPNMFIGNGLASEMGVGRGRGRAKKTPLDDLAPFYDDTENKFRPQGTPRIRPLLMNYGTPTDFVDTLMDSKQAKQRMVSSNMRLVLSISRKYANVGVNLQDLVQEGSLGLSRAAEKFEPKKGFKFSTYASWWIQQAVFRSIAYHSRTIRLPVHVHNLLNRIRKIRKNVEMELGRTPTNEEMAKQLDMPIGKYNKMMRLTRRSISLETPKYRQNPKDFGHEGDDLLRDTIDASVLHDDMRPEKGVDRNLFHEDLKEMLNILQDDERRVISARYGLEDGLTRTVTAVSAQMKMPKAWVRSKECRALRKLRRPWYETRLKEHQNSLTS